MTSVSVKNVSTNNAESCNMSSCEVANICDTQVMYSNHACSSVEERLEIAKSHCQSLSIRFTSLRETVYKIILTAEYPLGAYDIISVMQNQVIIDAVDEKPRTIAPPTVYRSLQFLLEYGFIHRLVSTNTFVPCCHPRSEHIAGFLICDECSRVQECSDDMLLSLINHTQDEIGFKVKTSMIELTGTCTICQNTEKTKNNA